MRTNVVVKRLVYMATKTEEVLGLRKAALENDYTISDINSYNQRNTGKEVSKDLIDIYLGLAEKYNIRDNEGNRDLNWVKVMKVIEFHNQVIGTILTTEGWW